MTKTPYARFVAELRRLRLARGWTQEAVAGKMRLSRAQYTAIETGRSLLNFAHLHNLAIAFGVRFVIGDPKKSVLR